MDINFHWPRWFLPRLRRRLWGHLENRSKVTGRAKSTKRFTVNLGIGEMEVEASAYVEQGETEQEALNAQKKT